MECLEQPVTTTSTDAPAAAFMKTTQITAVVALIIVAGVLSGQRR
jgi:hypothetical protein